MKVVAISLFLVSALLASATRASSLAGITPIAGGTFEASGAVYVHGGVLFVDDSKPEHLFWMTLDDDGRQVGAAEPVPLGTTIVDPEGITTDGKYVYVVGSQSKRASQSGVGLARFTFDAQSRQLTGAETVSELRNVIEQALPAVVQASGKRVDGFNIEGLTWDPQQKRLLLGLRAPVLEGEALVIPLRLKAPEGPFDRQNIVVDANAVARLPLGGAGIRSLEYDATTQRFWVISGAAGDAEAAFGLWTWDGAGALQRAPADAGIFDRKLKPEGITRVGSGQGFTLVVYDTSQYLTIH